MNTHSTPAHHCFTNYTRSMPLSTVMCTHWFTAYYPLRVKQSTQSYSHYSKIYVNNIIYNYNPVLSSLTEVAIRNVVFTDYVTSYWVESNRQLWNHYLTDDPRTTNHLKGWHSQLKKHLLANNTHIPISSRTTNHLEGWHSQLKKHRTTHTSQYLQEQPIIWRAGIVS